MNNTNNKIESSHYGTLESVSLFSEGHEILLSEALDKLKDVQGALNAFKRIYAEAEIINSGATLKAIKLFQDIDGIEDKKQILAKDLKVILDPHTDIKAQIKDYDNQLKLPFSVNSNNQLKRISDANKNAQELSETIINQVIDYSEYEAITQGYEDPDLVSEIVNVSSQTNAELYFEDEKLTIDVPQNVSLALEYDHFNLKDIQIIKLDSNNSFTAHIPIKLNDDFYHKCKVKKKDIKVEIPANNKMIMQLRYLYASRQRFDLDIQVNKHIATKVFTFNATKLNIEIKLADKITDDVLFLFGNNSE